VTIATGIYGWRRDVHDDDDDGVDVLNPVHTVQKGRQSPKTATVVENGDCRQKRRLSPNSATVAKNDSRQCGQGFMVHGTADMSLSTLASIVAECGQGYSRFMP